MTKSDPYAELFNAMAKEPVIPAGLTRIGEDVGRVVDRINDPTTARDIMGNPYHPSSCGEVGNVMPEVETSAQPQEFTSNVRGAYEIAPGITMAKLYAIIHDRLEYCRVNIDHSTEDRYIALERCTDIDVICQNVCCEVEKALGIYPNTGKSRVSDE